MSFKTLFPLLPVLFLLPAFAHPDNASPVSSSGQSSLAQETPEVQSTPSISKRNAKASNSSKVLVIHKPMPSPSWGRVIQYRREEISPLSESNREILHEFLFQDDLGVVRTAVFHETASGDGYWEVTVWDQP